MQRLMLRLYQSPGDCLVLTATVRDLHKAFPGQYQTDAHIALRSIATVAEAREAHDLAVVGERLATVGPWHDAIVLFDPLSKEPQVLRPWLPLPGGDLAEGEARDRFHMNSVNHDGEKFVLSMFSASAEAADQRWREMDLRHAANRCERVR